VSILSVMSFANIKMFELKRDNDLKGYSNFLGGKYAHFPTPPELNC